MHLIGSTYTGPFARRHSRRGKVAREPPHLLLLLCLRHTEWSNKPKEKVAEGFARGLNRKQAQQPSYTKCSF